MLNCLSWKALQSRRTIARLSLLYKLRNINLACVDNAELHPVAYSSTCSSGHAFRLPIIKCDFYKFSIVHILYTFSLHVSPQLLLN